MLHLFICVQVILLAPPADSRERLCNATVSVRPSVGLSVPSIDSSSYVQLFCRSPDAGARQLLPAPELNRGHRRCCDPRMIVADLECLQYCTLSTLRKSQTPLSISAVNSDNITTKNYNQQHTTLVGGVAQWLAAFVE